MDEEIEQCIHAVLGLKPPYQFVPQDDDSSSVIHLLFQADSLWNLGDTDQALNLLTNKIYPHDDFDETKHGSFARGIENLCIGSLLEALKHFQMAAESSTVNLNAVFFTERAVNIAFWLASSEQMLESAKVLESHVDKTLFAGGVLSFAIHMSGDSVAAEQVARKAIENGFDDPWTIHSVAHSLSSQGRSQECAEWIQRHRQKFKSCNAFMKGHMEFHLALCFLDMEDSNNLDKLIEGNLWGSMSDDMKNEYWNDVGLLNVMWKAELRLGDGNVLQKKHEKIIEQALDRAMSSLGGVNKSKSAVFSLCIFRFCSGALRDEWRDALISKNDADETQNVLGAVASAISLVYHQGVSEAGTEESRWKEAASVLAPIAMKLNKLGASPEQREVVQDFVGVVGKKSRGAGGLIPVNCIDVKAWYDRNQRPNVQFYQNIISEE